MTRTRFAPSPTGYLHIGGVRTALFNWLLARRDGGQFVLRIDDTDASRNRAEAVKPILDGFDWLGVDWDEGPTKDASGDSFGPHAPYFQGQRNEKYVAAAMKLVAEGKAYPDYTAQADQDERRKAAEKAKRPYVHRGSNRDVDPVENLRLLKETPAPILLRVPDGEAVVFDDAVRGVVKVQTDTIRDPALLRAPGPDGVCRALYSFATVVDEADFGITHVVRAEEHLSNTPTQILIFQALGVPTPKFGHVPLIYRNGKKITKRELPPLSGEEISKLKACGWTEEELKGRDDLNIATVAYYREMGYLPAALINYLVRLGWALDGATEMFPLETAIEKFRLEDVTKSPANFDSQKLYWLQGEYMKLLPAAEKVDRATPYLRRAGFAGESVDDALRAKLVAIVEAAGDRVKLFSDVLTFAAPFLRAEVDYDAKSVEKSLKSPGSAELLRGFREVLASADSWEPAALEKLLYDYATANGGKSKPLVAAVRVAVTGTTVGFGLYETLNLLGRGEALRRIDAAPV